MMKSGLRTLRALWISETLVGWRVFRVSFWAVIFTGGGVRVFFRPDGRSGWVTTASTLNWLESASRVGVTNWGVPKKMREGFMFRSFI